MITFNVSTTLRSIKKYQVTFYSRAKLKFYFACFLVDTTISVLFKEYLYVRFSDDLYYLYKNTCIFVYKKGIKYYNYKTNTFSVSLRI